MKLIPAAAALILWSTAPAWAELIEAPSVVDAVTAFPDRATVTRVVEVNLREGAHEIKLGGLPSSIDPASVAARGEGAANITLIGARLVTTQRETPQDARINELQAQLKELARRERTLTDARNILEQERKYLQSIQAASVEQVGKDIITRQPSAQDVASLFQFVSESLATNAKNVQDNDVALEELRETRDKVQRELSQLGYGRKSATAILVDLEAQRAGKFTLQVSYQLPGASWEPVYEARAMTSGSSVQLATAAMVSQRTGEDWANAQLTLSTARPALGGRMPELVPWYLRRWEPPVVYDKDGERAAKHMKVAGVAASPAPAYELGVSLGAVMGGSVEEQHEATMAEAAVESRGPAVQFVIARRETIESNGQPRKVPITQAELPAELAYEATPKLSPYAYLRAKVTNKSAAFLLPGQVQVFLDGAFVASSSIDGIAPGEQFDLYLGVDERIKVERTQLSRKEDVSILPGLHGKMKTVDYEYLTTIENHTGKAITLTLMDQVPISQHDEIKLENVTWTPTPNAKDEDPEKPGIKR